MMKMKRSLEGSRGLLERLVGSFLRAAGCGGALACGYCLMNRGFFPPAPRDGLRIWSDSLSMTGVILLGVTGGRKLERMGIFDWVGYGICQAKFLLSRGKDREYTGFYDYRMLKERGTAPLWPWGVMGILFLALGAALLGFYYS